MGAARRAGGETRTTPVRQRKAAWHRRRRKRGGLLAVGAHEPLDQVLDVARLGQATLGQLIGQFGLTQSFVRLAGLFLGLLGFFPLNAPGLAGLRLLGLFGFRGLLLGLSGFFPLDPLGFPGLRLLGLSSASSACSRLACSAFLSALLLGCLLGVLGLLDGQVGHDVSLVLHDAADLVGPARGRNRTGC